MTNPAMQVRECSHDGEKEGVTMPEGKPRKATTNHPQLFSILLDNSASMKEFDKDTNAKRLIEEAIVGFQERQEEPGQIEGERARIYVQLIKFDEQATEVLPFTAIQKIVPSKVIKELTFDGNYTNLAAALVIAHESIGKAIQEPKPIVGDVSIEEWSCIPEPWVLIITDGLPNIAPAGMDPVGGAIEWADKVKSLKVPKATGQIDLKKSVTWEEGPVKIVAIGVGEKEIDEDLLNKLASDSTDYKGNRANLYLVVPTGETMKHAGTALVGTLTQEAGKTLEEVIIEEGGKGTRSSE